MNDLCADIGYKSINHVGEELCGDHVDVVEEGENSTVIVLADGLGSGVKASILSTLTSKIISTMMAAGLPIEECVSTIAGALPVWLAPEQVMVLPVSNLFEDYAYEVLGQLRAAGLRAEIDNRNEKIGYRIREAQLSKVPYMIIVGANEEEQKNISVRSRKEAENKVMGVEEFTAQIKYEIENFVK